MVQIKFLKWLVLYITNKFKNIFYFYLMGKIKGGFPPINYDANKNLTDEKKSTDKKKSTDEKKSTRERLFVSNINTNINIRQILKENVSKPIFDLNEGKDDLQVVDGI